MCEETIVLLHQKGVSNIQFFSYYPGCKEKYDDIPLAITPGEGHFAPVGKEVLDIGNRVLDTNTLLEVISYPGCKEKYDDIPLAITPGEGHFAPVGKEVLDIGNRVLDTNTLLEVISFTDCEYLLKTDRLINYFDEISENNTGIESLISKMELATQQFNILLRLSSEGIILVDSTNNIVMCNQKANDFLGKGRIDVLYKPAETIFQNNIFEQAAKDEITKTVLFLSDTGVKLRLKVVPIVKHGVYLSGIGIITRANPEDEILTNAMNKILKKGHIARYTFDSIITKTKNVTKIKEVAKKMAKSNSAVLITGESGTGKELFAHSIHNYSSRKDKTKNVTKIKEVAKKMAKSNSAVLITGESGTGKELFAHSIHNYSSRKDKPFVAINCAALADNLLESELFGYEEGAFTGAKKGGKTGLFEIANNGTQDFLKLQITEPFSLMKLKE